MSGPTNKMIHCAKLDQEAPALSRPPVPGALGQRLLEAVSAPAWQMWLKHQTMLINEYRLNLMEKKARDFLLDEMQKFFFEGGSETPPDFIPQG